MKALPLLGDEPFFHMNADTMWIDGVQPNLDRLAAAFDPARMDILLLMAPTANSIGYDGAGDYMMMTDGSLRKRKEHQVVPFVYAGAAIISPSIFKGVPAGDSSLINQFDALPNRIACSACGLKACGCMSERRTRCMPRKKRSSPAWLNSHASCGPRRGMMGSVPRIGPPWRVFNVAASAPFFAYRHRRSGRWYADRRLFGAR